MSSPAAERDLTPYTPRTLRAWAGPLPGFRTAEGTMIFADVSGFTRLTERLARRGKVGAEEMVTTISQVWEALLATDDGGDVLKFAGDALLLFYEGEGHATRAARRALSMQKELERVGRIESAGSVVRLRMSIGVHSGDFHLFAVGDDYVDLLVLGEAATTTLGMESLASAGQVVASTETVRRIDGALLGRALDGGAVLKALASNGATPPAVPAGHIEPERFVAPSLRDRLGSGDHEHRWAAVAFAHLGGLDSMFGTAGAEVTFDLVQEFAGSVIEVLDEYEILLASCDMMRNGAGFMLTAGVPDARGDDATRMLHVAARLVDLADPLQLRVGVNAGNVFAGDVGPPFRRAFVTMGDTTNVAARVMSQADWGSVLATHEALEATDGRFLTRPLDPFGVKGKRRPVEASVVEGVEATGGAVAGAGPYLGRETEMAAILELVDRVRSGRGITVEIVGEQGSGKSRLVAEVRRQTTDLDPIVVVCDPFERTSPYHSARRLLRQILGISADASPAGATSALTALADGLAPDQRRWLPLLNGPLDAALDETPEAKEIGVRYRRERTQQVAADLVEAVAVPGMVVIEDASAMDDASAELVAELLRRIDRLPWLAVVTRTADTTGLHAGRGYDATVIELKPLHGEIATELARRLAETQPVPQHLIPAIVSRAGGNPLFLSELVMGVEGGEMPQSVEGLVAARIDRLSPDDRRLLRFLSVLGEQFDASLVDDVLGDLGVAVDDTGLWSRLGGFVRRSGDRFSFVNPLVRQVAYEGLTFGRRRQIHSRVADLLAGRQGEPVPLHLARAERWEEAWEAARAAGDRARAAGANAVAAELYELALDAARHVGPPDADLAEVAAGAGDSWARVGIPDRALEAYGTALAATQDETEHLLLAARRAGVHENAGRFPQALGLYTRAMRAAEDLEGDSRDRVLGVLHAGYASTRQRQGRLEEAIEHATRAVEYAETAGDSETLAYLHHLLDRLHTGAGNRNTALRHRDAALPLFAALGDLAAQGTVLHDLAADAHRGGRLEEAMWLYQRAIEARTRAGDVVRAAASVNALGEVDQQLGNTGEAESRFTEALRIWRGARSPEGVVVAATNLGSLHLDRDDPGSALKWLEEAETAASEIGADQLLPRTRLSLARAYLVLERHVESWDAATLALAAATGPAEQVEARRYRARALLATGGAERAAGELREALGVARAAGLDDLVEEIQSFLPTRTEEVPPRRN